jgi:hypothetical protein
MMTNYQKIIDKYSEQIGQKKNVVAVAIGKKWVNGTPSDKDAIIVLVKEKVPLDQLSESDKIPKNLDGVITDVVGKVGDIQSLAYTKRYRPAPGGVSCGHPRITAGTLGAYFRDRSKHTVILSNNHVLAAENRSRVGDYIYQPGKYDGGTSRDKIGNLKAFQRLVKRNQRITNPHLRRRVNYNLEDSAIAKVTNRKFANDSIKDIGKIVGFNHNPRVGLAVQKTGRTTGHTRGRVIGIHATVYVNYSMGTLIFKDQILTNAMSQGGDSGSLLLDNNRKAVGLLFAGSNSITVHNYIKYPVRKYRLSLIKPAPVRRVPSRRRTPRRNRRLEQIRKRLRKIRERREARRRRALRNRNRRRRRR